MSWTLASRGWWRALAPLQLLISNGAQATAMQAKALIAREALAPRLGGRGGGV
jgi:hypothetical protein